MYAEYPRKFMRGTHRSHKFRFLQPAQILRGKWRERPRMNIPLRNRRLSVIIHPMARPKSKATTPKIGLSAMVEKHERLVVIGLVALGLLVRLAHFFQIEANDPYFYFPSVDPGVYHEWATRIASGEWLGDDVFFLAPLYPYALGVLYKITGASLYAARLFQLVIGAGSCALIYLLGKRTLGAATGALAALTWSIYSMSVFYDGVLLVAAIQTPLNLLLALALVRASSRPGGVLNWPWQERSSASAPLRGPTSSFSSSPYCPGCTSHFAAGFQKRDW